MGGCDPETMTKEKVPTLIKDLLTFEGSVGAKQAKSVAAALEIKSPKPDQIFPADKDVLFQADLPKQDGKAPGPGIAWRVVSTKDGRPQDVGAGLSATKRLRPGSYSAEMQATFGEQKIVKTVAFRVSFMISGKITSKDGAGVAQADVELVDVKEKKSVSKAQSGNDGAFTLELPSEDEYRVIVRKKDYLFSPTYREIKSPKDGPIEFSAQKGAITDIHLTKSEDAEGNLKSLCPTETVFLKCKVQAEEKPSSLQVFLVDPKNEGRLMSFEPKEAGKLDEHTDASGFTRLKMTAPSASTVGQPADSYVIWIKVRDKRDDSYLAQLPEPVVVDYEQCFPSRLAEGVDAQQKGKDSEAIRIYSLMEDMFNAIHKVRPFMETMDKALFNRGLAYLKMALDDKDESSRVALLTKSIQDFNRYIKARRSDGQAYMLRGAAYQAKGDYKAALKDCDASIETHPQSGPTFELRGRAHMKLGTKKNLLQAIDDFTLALGADPGDKAARETRRESTKLALKYRENADDHKVDTSQVPLEPLDEWLNLLKYLRK